MRTLSQTNRMESAKHAVLDCSVMMDCTARTTNGTAQISIKKVETMTSVRKDLSRMNMEDAQDAKETHTALME